ncbi:hypothetical protein PLESTM_000423500 [Pleodorina starrii]|nr:hypothetical protein PLESTM_000423500 [Pleodorina starrii]
MDSLAASGIFCPAPRPTKQAAGPTARLCSSTRRIARLGWRPLRVPSTAGYTAGDGSKAQHMLIKTSCFYSEQRATKALAAAARRGRAVYVPMERDAMHEVRAAVKASLARASASVLGRLFIRGLVIVAGDDATGFLAVNEAGPTAQQQRIQAWLHDSE